MALHRLIDGHTCTEKICEDISAFVGFSDQIKTLHERRGPVFKTSQSELVSVFLDEVPGFIERINALVHPCVGAFVAAEDAVKPVVANLVDDDGLEPKGAPAVANDRNIGVFHTAARTDGAVHRSNVVVRVLPVPFGVIVRGVLDIGQRRTPEISSCWSKHGPRSHGSPRVRKLHFALEHPPAFVGKPRKVMDIELAIAKGFGARGGFGKFHGLLRIERLRIERASVHPASRCERQGVQEG